MDMTASTLVINIRDAVITVLVVGAIFWVAQWFVSPIRIEQEKKLDRSRHGRRLNGPQINDAISILKQAAGSVVQVLAPSGMDDIEIAEDIRKAFISANWINPGHSVAESVGTQFRRGITIRCTTVDLANLCDEAFSDKLDDLKILGLSTSERSVWIEVGHRVSRKDCPMKPCLLYGRPGHSANTITSHDWDGESLTAWCENRPIDPTYLEELRAKK